MLTRLRWRLACAWAAFKYAQTPPHYAVVYDSYERDGQDNDPAEEYYEVFMKPGEAQDMFRSAFPRQLPRLTENERLVMVLGPIDQFKGAF
jgi:hypothetical protein